MACFRKQTNNWCEVQQREKQEDDEKLNESERITEKVWKESSRDYWFLVTAWDMGRHARR